MLGKRHAGKGFYVFWKATLLLGKMWIIQNSLAVRRRGCVRCDRKAKQSVGIVCGRRDEGVAGHVDPD